MARRIPAPAFASACFLTVAAGAGLIVPAAISAQGRVLGGFRPTTTDDE